MKESILRLTNIHAGYGNIDVLTDVSMEVPDSKITAIIGPNGAGKSTLLKTIYGLLKAKRGKILFRGEEITGLEPAAILRKGIAYVPQGRRSIFPLLTVRENLKMGAYIRDDRKVAQDINEVMEKFPILKKRERELAGNLSGGEQQILAMGMSLLLSPELLLLDEPSLGLSPRFQNIIFEDILRINGRGTAILMVEQMVTKALKMADYAVVLELGQKRFEGTGKEILENDEVKRLYIGG